ncbi:hypothetical protein OPQ81_009050 [Rhizoctonia solani]|nr:hypothetical protein OPQ81_009050 [Rhizoctonia solani]
MPGPNLPNPSLVSAIERLIAATEKLPLSTREGRIHSYSLYIDRYRGRAKSSCDSEFDPQPTPTSSELDSSSGWSDIGEEITNGRLKSAKPLQRARKRHTTVNSVGGVGGIEHNQAHVKCAVQSIELAGKKWGRDPIVREWAFAHHEKSIESMRILRIGCRKTESSTWPHI